MRSTNSLWDVIVPVAGHCPNCGEEIGTEVRIHASAEWIVRYHQDDRLRRGINRSVVRTVETQHARQCAGQRQRQRVAAYAASA